MMSLGNSMDSDSEPKLIRLLTQLVDHDTTDSDTVSITVKIIYLLRSIDLESQPKPESELMSLVTQAISNFNSMVLDWQSKPEPLRELMSLVAQAVSVFTSMDLDSQVEPLSQLISLIFQKFPFLSSVDSKFKSYFQESSCLEPELELISLIDQILSPFKLESEYMLLLWNSDLESDDFEESRSLETEPELESDQLNSHELSNQSESIRNSMDPKSNDVQFFSLIHQKNSLSNSDVEPEMRLLSLISQLTCALSASKFISLIIQIFALLSSMDLDLQPKPESELISLIAQAISVFNSKPPSLQLISLISHKLSILNSKDFESESESEFMSVVEETLSPKPEMELISIIHQIYSLVVSMNSASGKHLFLCAQLDVRLEGGKFHVTEEDKWLRNSMWGCHHAQGWEEFRSKEGEEATHFLCRSCFGENHRFNKAPVEIKHSLHPKHSLQLVLLADDEDTRKCYCCDKNLLEIFYYCSACDFAMNVACVEKPPLLLTIDHPRWHEHTLALFTRQTPLACNLCAVADLSSPIYVCPPCGFVVHLRCINLPRVIRISRHPHRISFTPSFEQGDWSCHVCREMMDNDYGGYSCIKYGCLYVAHSRCATQSNVWDGRELEGEPCPSEGSRYVPFQRLGDGIIDYIYHQHPLRLDEDVGRDYDESKQCHGCSTPIYFGNFYSCMTCDYILHEECVSLSRKIHHPIHPHMLTLVRSLDCGAYYTCSACSLLLTAGLFYECHKKACSFQVHVQCGTISEPSIHESHMHPLFLTSKPMLGYQPKVPHRKLDKVVSNI